MDIDEEGRVCDYEMEESLIRSDHRLTYKGVQKVLDGERGKYPAEIEEMLFAMADLAAVLREDRQAEGSIDFDLPEATIVLNEDGFPVEMGVAARTAAHRLIEEFMLACNKTVARHFHWLKTPFLYRVHEEPHEDSVEELAEFLGKLGYSLKTARSPHPKMFQAVLKETEGREEEALIKNVMLRSMERARYSPQNEGHFGLAAACYTHFTSPIRRYPDLVVHRIVKEWLVKNRLSPEIRSRLEEELDPIAKRASARERVAEEAERDSVEVKKVQYMAEKVGDVYEGIISGVTGYGLYVQLPNTAEGFVHVSRMTDDYYHFQEEDYALVGENKGNVYRLGDEVEVRVINVDFDKVQVELVLM